MTGLLLAGGHAGALFGGFIAVLGIVALGALELERRLPPTANVVVGTSRRDSSAAIAFRVAVE